VNYTHSKGGYNGNLKIQNLETVKWGMRGYNDDSEDIKLVKEYYYTQAVNQLKNSLWYRNHKGR
jgi:hypothetical protein